VNVSAKSSRQNSISTTVRRRPSRITYDREQGKRYYRGTDMSDRYDCSVDEI
jgi:hypothetical protein